MATTAAWTRWALALGLAGALVGCKPVDEKNADASDEPGDDASMQERDGGNTRADGGNTRPDGGGPDGGAGDGGADGSMPVEESAPELEQATARQAGRFGEDFRLDVTGTDPDGDAIAVRITLHAANGPIALADTDGDGDKDVGEAELPLKAALASTPSASSYLVIPGLFRDVAALDHAEVALVDAAGHASESIEVPVLMQEVLAADEICDAEFIENRCADGYGCKGSAPSVCTAGVAPIISRIFYYADDLGTRVLLEGTDADVDARRYRIEFFDASNQPVMIDTDSDDTPDRSDWEDMGSFVWDGTKFFLRLDQGDTFSETVAKVRVTIIDRGNLSSAPSALIAKTTTPTRTAGQSCDPRTFDRCVASAVCVPTSATSKTYSCMASGSARTRACSTAAVLDPAEGVTSVRGDIKDPSLWDPPEGCVGGSSTRQPEALVKLVLAEAASKVTLSTSNLYTSFDSSLYVLSACNATPVIAWCEDYGLDRESSAAEIELTDLAAGDYFVVVDSFNSALSGTTFQLDVTVE